MRDLPSSWTSARLDNILTRIIGGGTPSKTNSAYFEGYIPFMTVKDLYGRFPSDTIDHISQEAIASSATALIPADTLIVATRMSLGKIVRPVVDVAINQDLKALFLVEDVNKTYIEYFWRSQADYIQSLGTGTTVKGIRLEDIRNLEIPLAPLPEQTRIADKLDAVLARVDACRERLDHIPAILKRFRQSVLDAATSGRLTKDWRGSEALDGWRTDALADLCHSVSDGDHQAPPQTDTGIPFITIAAINDGRLRLEKATRFVPTSYFETQKLARRPVRGDILFSVTGSIGIPALVDIDDPFTFQRHIAILRPNHARVSSAYLASALGSENIRQQALAAATGTAQLTIPLNRLRSFVIPLPPAEEQAEIVRRVETLFAFADHLETRYTAARAQVEKLTPSLLAKAFRGELVPQDPNDEPASTLLERISEHRASQLIEKKNDRSSKEKSMKTSPPISLSEIISRTGTDSFTFEQLRDEASRDYESLKEELFTLLADAGSGLTQVFDAETQSMRFKRVRK